MKLKIYGSKGSAPYFRHDYRIYGGNTTCVRLDVAEQTIILDCGSGLGGFWLDLLQEPQRGKDRKIDILLSHLHFDHIQGLPTFPPLLDKDYADMRIHTRSRDERQLKAQIFAPFKPPYWPINLEDMVRTEIFDLSEEPIRLAPHIKVSHLDAPHPDMTTSFRIEADKTLVYLLDSEFRTEEDLARAADFCRGADMVVFDAAYLPEDYPPRQNWGHSTFEMGVALYRLAECGKIIFSHLSYDYNDARIETIHARIPQGISYAIAYDGMECVI